MLGAVQGRVTWNRASVKMMAVSGRSGHPGDHRMHPFGQIDPCFGDRQMPLVRARQTSEAAAVADGVLQLPGHGHETVGISSCLGVAGEVDGRQLMRPAGIQQASVAAVKAPPGEILVEGAVGVDVDVVDAEGREPSGPPAPEYLFEDVGDHRDVEQVDERLGPEAAPVGVLRVELRAPCVDGGLQFRNLPRGYRILDSEETPGVEGEALFLVHGRIGLLFRDVSGFRYQLAVETDRQTSRICPCPQGRGGHSGYGTSG